jgi:phosphate/sulfate permease
VGAVVEPFPARRGVDRAIFDIHVLAESASFWSLSPFFYAAALLAVVMLLWDSVEVGRNDGVNIVNSVFGARILSGAWAIRLAGVGVVLGAYLSSDVIETARKGIFAPEVFDLYQALSIYISVYIVDTILLYTYSAFGMPVSTTMTLVFELLGAAFFLGWLRSGGSGDAVHWANAGKVVLGIICSIFLSGAIGFFLQRAVRGAIRDKWSSLATLLLHGGWIGGGLMAGLSYFMLVKGMKGIHVVKQFKAMVFQEDYGPIMLIVALWVFYAIAIHSALVLFRKKAAALLFPVIAVIGMVAMGFAFGQNDLANCASPGLAAIALIRGHLAGQSVAAVTEVPIAGWELLGCGILLSLGMMTKNSTRVNHAVVRAGSAGDHVKLWAPRWCISLAGAILKMQRASPSLAPAITKTPRGKTMHFDPPRASVIVCVSACVIATASALALPVSTTYVAYAAVVATGLADRIFVRGDAALKLGRSIWVISCWFLAAMMATIATGIVCLAVYYLSVGGMILCVVANLFVRNYMKKRGDEQERRIRLEAEERMHPDDFATEDD